jgi:hypothetical protein
VVRAGWRAGVVVAALLASGVAGGPEVVASTPGGSGDVLADQTRLIAAADLIKGAGWDGYAGISLAPEKGELSLYWKGTLPAQVQRAVDKARREMGVRVLPAAHSERELLEVARRLAKEPGVTSVGPKVDGSGLRLGYAGNRTSAEAVPAIRDAGVDIEVERSEYVRAASLAQPSQCALRPVTRQVDWCPYSGGAKYTFQQDGETYRCTTGWPVRFNWTPGGSGVQYQLTAGHCGSDGLVVNNGAGAVMGTVEQDTDSRDLMLIKTPSAPTMFAGTWNSNVLKTVSGVRGNYPGAYMCTSGSVSGQHCDLVVEDTNQEINLLADDGTTYPVAPMVVAASRNGTVAVARGDSGGPVAAQDAVVPGAGLTLPYVYGVGTISAGEDEVECPRGTVAQATTCFQRVWYAPLQESLAHLNVSLITG